MRDRIAAIMLRAATTGSFDYRGADPYDKKWRVKHMLVIQEVDRAINEQILRSAHSHWLAYVTHSNLNPDSWQKAKDNASDILRDLHAVITPWHKTAENTQKNSTIEGKYGKLIKQYKDMVARKEAERQQQRQQQQQQQTQPDNENNPQQE